MGNSDIADVLGVTFTTVMVVLFAYAAVSNNTNLSIPASFRTIMAASAIAGAILGSVLVFVFDVDIPTGTT